MFPPEQVPMGPGMDPGMMGMEPAGLDTADPMLGAAPMPPSAGEALAALVGTLEQDIEQKQQAMALAAEILMRALQGGMETADPMMGGLPEDDPLGEEPVEPAGEFGDGMEYPEEMAA